jgi:hypothetical protein
MEQNGDRENVGSCRRIDLCGHVNGTVRFMVNVGRSVGGRVVGK